MRGEGRGGQRGGGGSGADANRIGVILFVQLKMRGCIKLYNHF